jgi:hypothetical protein
MLLFVVLLATPAVGQGESPQVLEVGKFSAAAEGAVLPDGWKPLTFPKRRHTSYTLIKDGCTVVIKATSKASASGLTREIKIDLKEYPIVQWRWKVANILKKGDVTKKEGDDYPARLYIIFQFQPEKVSFLEKTAARLLYGHDPPSGAINYLWESKSPKGTLVPNPSSDRIKMIVVESGSASLNQWLTEERNVYEDYKQAFGEEPPLISGVAIMTDTDDTGESATAYYGDIVFKKAAR